MWAQVLSTFEMFSNTPREAAAKLEHCTIFCRFFFLTCPLYSAQDRRFHLTQNMDIYARHITIWYLAHYMCSRADAHSAIVNTKSTSVDDALLFNDSDGPTSHFPPLLLQCVYTCDWKVFVSCVLWIPSFTHTFKFTLCWLFWCAEYYFCFHMVYIQHTKELFISNYYE